MPHVQRRVLVEVAAPRDEVRAFIDEHFADEDALTFEFDDGGVEIVATSAIELPFFGWAIEPFIARQLVQSARHAAALILHRFGDGPAPEPRKASAALPSVDFTKEQADLLATAAWSVAIATFATAIIGQYGQNIADSFHAGNGALGNALAFSRVGALVGLFGMALADRVGRRKVILIGLAGVCIANGLSALAPNLVVLAGFQMFTRGFSYVNGIAAGIAAVEEAPEGARAYAASMMALAGGLGFSISVVLLPLADLAPWAWRIPFVLSALSLLWLPKIARHLTETARYQRLVGAGTERGRTREVVSGRYLKRFVLLAAATFFLNVLSAPSAQFMNKYLKDVHHYSNLSILGIRAATTGIPGLIGLLLASRLSERYGRRPVGAVALFLGALGRIAFFLTGGIALWSASAGSDLTMACGTMALATLDAELFPTEIRGTANGFILVVSVLGSALGLFGVGHLADSVGGLGHALALCAIGTLIAAVFIVPFLDESAHRTLDDVSPSEPS